MDANITFPHWAGPGGLSIMTNDEDNEDVTFLTSICSKSKDNQFLQQYTHSLVLWMEEADQCTCEKELTIQTNIAYTTNLLVD